MDELVAALQPYANVVSAVLSLAILAFVLNLVKLARDAAADRVKVFEDRLAAAGDRLTAAKEDQERAEKWQQRERERLEADLREKQHHLESVLRNAGLDLSSLALGTGIKAAADDLRQEVEALTSELRSQLQALPPPDASVSDVRRSAKVTLAKGDLAAERWATAASLLDESVDDGTITDWRYHLARGVAHAKARGGNTSDLAALRAYNDAIAFIPADLEENSRGRLFTYRAAMNKRLGRTDEALSDLQLARRLAAGSYEVVDNLYNFACVYALRGERQQMLEALHEIQKCGGNFGRVRRHLHDYFAHFRTDPDFKAVVGV